MTKIQGRKALYFLVLRENYHISILRSDITIKHEVFIFRYGVGHIVISNKFAIFQYEDRHIAIKHEVFIFQYDASNIAVNNEVVIFQYDEVMLILITK